MRLISFVTVFLFATALPAATFELHPKEHVCLIGNALPERMQHFGWLETFIHARYPRHELVFRNLGYGGDEVNGYRDLYSRMRSMDFGSQDQWLAGEAPIPQPQKLNKDAPVSANRFRLTNTRADVVFAFYGYNESFAGAAGVGKFKEDLDRFIKHTLAQRYNGKSPPRLVLFSPIAHENLGDPNLPDGVEDNRRLELYTRAMAEVAHADGVFFVDLFTPSRQFFDRSSGPRSTINGIHLTERGDRVVAGFAYQGLFGERPAFDKDRIEKLRAAVNDKNWYWFNRYRTTDGYSTYGDRAFLRFVNGQTNYEVVQRELETIDLLTVQPRQGRVGGRTRKRRSGRRLESSRLHPGDLEQAGTASRRKTHLSERRGRDRQDDRPQGNEGQSVRLRGAIPRAGEPRANGVRHPGPAVGRRLARPIRTGSRPKRPTTSC